MPDCRSCEVTEIGKHVGNKLDGRVPVDILGIETVDGAVLKVSFHSFTPLLNLSPDITSNLRASDKRSRIYPKYCILTDLLGWSEAL